MPILCAPVLRAQPAPSETVHVTGTVINSASSQPLAGALVIFTSSKFQGTNDAVGDVAGDKPPMPQIQTRRAVTDVSGSFAFDAPSDAASVITVSKPGFRGAANEDTVTLNVDPDHAQGLIARLSPLGTINGRVVNQDGDPVQGLTVQAMGVEIRDGRHQLVEVASRVTDDRGEYRLWYLNPGPYYLKVIGHGLSSDSYGPAYYPSGTDPGSAQLLKLGAGQTIVADFGLQGYVGRQIRGVLLNLPPGRPVVMRLVRSTDTLANRVQMDPAHSQFAVLDVPPGSYVVQAYTSDAGPILFGEAPVTVGNSSLPVTGISISLAPAADVTIRVESPPPADVPGSAGNRIQARLQAIPMNPLTLPRNHAFAGYAMPQPDGTMLMKGLLPGKYYLDVSPFGDNYVAAARQGDTDVLVDGFAVTSSGAQDITVTMAAGGGPIQGTIDGAADGSVWMGAVVPVAGTGAPMIFNASDGDGTFASPSVPQGTYNVYVWPASKEIAYREPNAFSAFQAYMTLATVTDSESQITLKPIPAEAIP